MKAKIKLMLVQPVMTSYRYDYFLSFASQFKLTCYADRRAQGGFLEECEGLNVVHSPISEILGGKVIFQKNVLKGVLQKPDFIFINANVRNLTLWILLLISRLMGVKVILHGQGLYKVKRANIFTKLVYALVISASTCYVCYAPISKSSLDFLPKFLSKKLRVINNTLVNKFENPPENKNFDVTGILFLGRLRKGCELERLVSNIEILNSVSQRRMHIHVIGSGDLESYYNAKYKDLSYITMYGAIYDQEVIRDISMNCIVGCYPGAAGLSVVHYMSLSLIPLVDGDITKHMGPEPSYVEDGFNGFLFDGVVADGISNTLLRLLKLPSLLDVSHRAYSTYKDLNNPAWDKAVIQLIENGFH
jgi:glycosyltransferase involved in cell wall biosynthesis